MSRLLTIKPRRRWAQIRVVVVCRLWAVISRSLTRRLVARAPPELLTLQIRRAPAIQPPPATQSDSAVAASIGIHLQLLPMGPRGRLQLRVLHSAGTLHRQQAQAAAGLIST